MLRPFLPYLAVWLALVMTGLAAPGDAEPGFNPTFFQWPRALMVQADGQVVVGGDFTMVNSQPRNYLARLTANAALDAGYDPNLSLWARTLVALPNGQVLLGGTFTTVGGQSQPNLARLNVNGTLDPPFAAGVPGTAYGVVPLDNGQVLAGGLHSPGPAGYVRRLNANGSVDANFSVTANGIVYTMARQPDGKIVIGGLFTQINGQPRNYVARLNADGTLDPNFDPQADNTVFCVALQPDGRVLLGGSFTTVGGQTRRTLARVEANGTLDMAFAPNFTAGGFGHAFSVVLQTDGKILAGGTFQSPASRIVRLTASGTTDATFNPNSNEEVYGIAGQADGKFLVCGKFGFIGGASRSGLVRLNNDAATQSLTVSSAARVQWLRGGASPEAVAVTFEVSTNGSVWNSLGAGVRMAGGWELTGLSLPASGYVRARARVPGGYFSNSSSLLESVQVFSLLTPLQQWKLAQLGNANAPDLDDGEGDGLVNLAEYGLVLSPTTYSPAPGASAFAYPEGTRLRLFFNRDPARNDVSIEVRAASDPAGPWTTIASSVLGGVTTGAGYVGGDGAGPGVKTVEVRDVVNISSAAQRFLRLRVTVGAPPVAPAMAPPKISAPKLRAKVRR